MPEAQVICSGLVDRIGLEGAKVEYKAVNESGEIRKTLDIPVPDHATGLKAVADLLTDAEVGVISNSDQIHIVGHRVVHGGEKFSQTQFITPEVKDAIEELFPLAPLHNPASHHGIEVAEKIFEKAYQVVVFDTAFHQTIPPVGFRMAIPNEYYDKYRMRSYGFHGISHKYVSERAIEIIGKKESKIITIHLGNGCSIAAVKDGKCIDTSMGLGPMNGLIMGTRVGDIDQSVIFYLVNQLGYSLDEVNTVLNKKSGMMGLTGYSDMREIRHLYEQGEKKAILAYQLYTYRIRKYIGFYAAVLNGLDAIVFTAGVGENDPLTRQLVCHDLDFLGIRLDNSKNEAKQGGAREVQDTSSAVKILVIPTNEELEIAKQCYSLVKTEG